MSDFRVRTATEQVVDHLRNEFMRGTWGETLPGSLRLAEDLGVGHGTIDAALRMLEKEGLLVSNGVGRRRRIVPGHKGRAPTLRIAILPYDQSDEKLHYMVDLVHRLREAGHASNFTAKSLVDLKMDPRRIMRLVNKHKADAWVVGSGSREVLEWFARRPEPSFALLGRRRSITMAGSGPDKMEALQHLVRRLVELGHRRIVILAREERRKPRPAAFEQAFLDQLEAHGIPTGHYNLPEWEGTPESLEQRLDSIFAHTPPTALFIEEMPLFVAVLQYLASRGIVVPRDVSLVCDDPNPAFDWCRPSVAHIDWDDQPLVRRVTKWADRIARGIKDHRQSTIPARFVEGGTVGPARA
jgi:DNA-binding LacI/PurR family transcriptional regulator